MICLFMYLHIFFSFKEHMEEDAYNAVKDVHVVVEDLKVCFKDHMEVVIYVL